MAEPLTDQAIAKIKALIISGEFTAGAPGGRGTALGGIGGR